MRSNSARKAKQYCSASSSGSHLVIGNGEFKTRNEEAEAKHADEIAALRKRILDKLERVRERDSRQKIEEGWEQDGEHWIPPGWVKSDGTAGQS